MRKELDDYEDLVMVDFVLNVFSIPEFSIVKFGIYGVDLDCKLLVRFSQTQVIDKILRRYFSILDNSNMNSARYLIIQNLLTKIFDGSFHYFSKYIILNTRLKMKFSQLIMKANENMNL